MMIKIIFNKADPTTHSGINSLKNELNVFNLKDYDGNVARMLDEMKLKCNEIYNQGSTHDDFLLNIFNALKTSSDPQFLKFISNKCDTWNEDKLTDTEEQLMNAAVKKYNNILKNKKSSASKSSEKKLKEMIL